MLILSRMKDERIMIGDQIVITVADIRGDKVRLGISAPKHMRVDREEVVNRITKERTRRHGSRTIGSKQNDP